jgi:hypothetical protein
MLPINNNENHKIMTLTKKIITKIKNLMKIVLRNPFGQIKRLLNWNRADYPINVVQPSTNSTPIRPPRRKKANTIAPLDNSNNVTVISHINNSTMHDIDNDDEDKRINGESMHI